MPGFLHSLNVFGQPRAASGASADGSICHPDTPALGQSARRQRCVFRAGANTGRSDDASAYGRTRGLCQARWRAVGRPGAVPQRGEHSADILRSVGLSETEIGQLLSSD